MRRRTPADDLHAEPIGRPTVHTELIERIADHDLDPLGVEAWMRTKYRTLDHLDAQSYDEAVEAASALARTYPEATRALIEFCR